MGDKILLQNDFLTSAEVHVKLPQHEAATGTFIPKRLTLGGTHLKWLPYISAASHQLSIHFYTERALWIFSSVTYIKIALEKGRKGTITTTKNSFSAQTGISVLFKTDDKNDDSGYWGMHCYLCNACLDTHNPQTHISDQNKRFIKWSIHFINRLLWLDHRHKVMHTKKKASQRRHATPDPTLTQIGKHASTYSPQFPQILSEIRKDKHVIER